MKDERSVRQRRAAGRKWRPAALILAAVLVFLSLPAVSRSAYAAEGDPQGDGTCTLTVRPGSVELMEDLATANIVVDLYRVADASKNPSYDTFDWTLTAPFDGKVTIDTSLDNAGWRKAAQDAAEVVLGTAPEGSTEWNPSETTAKIPENLKNTGNASGANGAVVSGLQPGIYLIVAHGSDIESYASSDSSTTPAAGSETDPAAAQANGTVTLANSAKVQYKFGPELVALPAKAADSIDPSMTSDPGPWLYEATATLKPTQGPRIGSLAIRKDLLTYEEREKTNPADAEDNPGTRQIKDTATFIFEVSLYTNAASYNAGDPGQNRIFHDFVSITFDSYGAKTVRIDNLPVGAYAVVTEEYSNKAYTIDTTPSYDDASQLIPANDVLTVEFENDYDDKQTGGGSVTNKFTYSTDASKWGWQQVTDDSEDGTVVQSDAQNQ